MNLKPEQVDELPVLIYHGMSVSEMADYFSISEDNMSTLLHGKYQATYKAHKYKARLEARDALSRITKGDNMKLALESSKFLLNSIKDEELGSNRVLRVEFV